MRVVLIGPPGAGKGTQAVELAKNLGVPHISTGEMLREEVRGHTDIGKQVEGLLGEGKLVPDALILSMVRGRLARADARGGFLLDGFPRSVVQADALDMLLGEMMKPLSGAVLLSLTDKDIVFRLSHRRTCEGCGRSYHMRLRPPLIQGFCDCGHALSQRQDDQESAILTRLEVYHRQTEPVLDYYRSRGILVKVDAIGGVHAVRDEIVRCLEGIAA